MSLKALIDQELENGYVSIKLLKEKKPYLYKVIVDPNSKELIKDLPILFDDRLFKCQADGTKFLRLLYGIRVDLTHLKKHYRTQYLAVNRMGNVKNVIESWGFECYYSAKDYADKIQKLTPENDSRRKIYNKLYYQSRKRGITVDELRKELRKSDKC
jgi:hypothetical protein